MQPTVVTQSSDTAVYRGVRTTFQSIIGGIVTFIVGLFLVVWGVPGVADAVAAYTISHLTDALAGLVGFSVANGFVAFVWNLLRSNVKNW